MMNDIERYKIEEATCRNLARKGVKKAIITALVGAISITGSVLLIAGVIEFNLLTLIFPVGALAFLKYWMFMYLAQGIEEARYYNEQADNYKRLQEMGVK